MDANTNTPGFGTPGDSDVNSAAPAIGSAPLQSDADHSTAGAPPRHATTNQEFLEAVFRNAGPDEFIWYTFFKEDPGSANASWHGYPLTPGQVPSKLGRQEHNAFFSIGTVRNKDAGRRITNAARVHAVVADDYNVKSTEHLKLPPSYMLETSPGSFHVGYFLTEPTDPETGARLQQALAAQGKVGDTGANTPIRYMRLPFGRNTKAKYRTDESPGGFDHVLHEWHPNQTYTVEEIVKAFELNLDDIQPQVRSGSVGPAAGVPKEVAEKDPYLRALREQGLLTGSLLHKGKSGWWHDLICPWLDNEEHGHTPCDGAETGTAYRVGGGFKCFHSHSDKLTQHDLKSWLRDRGHDTDALDAEQAQLFAPFDFEPVDESDVPEPDPVELERRARMREEEGARHERDRIEQEAQALANEVFDTTLQERLQAGLASGSADPMPEVQQIALELASHVRGSSTGWRILKNDAAGSVEASAALDGLFKRAVKATGATKDTLGKVLKQAGVAAREAGFDAARIHREALAGELTDVASDDEDLDGAPFDDPEPWPAPVDGAVLANELAEMYRNHVIFQNPHEADALALWVMGIYVMDRWRVWPKVLIQSPEKRCGKSTLLEITSSVAHRAFPCTNVTSAVLFRAIDLWHPTLLIDEADTFLKDDKELNGIINAGHTRRGANVPRSVERNGDWTVKTFSVWGPQMIAGIGNQRDTLADRSLRVTLRRRLPEEQVASLPYDIYERKLDLRRKLKRWAIDNAARLDPEPLHETLPVLGGNDRARDNWVALFALAEVLGGDWPERTDLAYRGMNLGIPDETSIGLQALRDVMAMFRTLAKAEAIPTATVLATLAAMDERLWGAWGRGRAPITSHALGRLLKPFDIFSRDRKLNGKGIKHFFRAQVEDAYDRYCGSWADGDAAADPVEIREHPEFEPLPARRDERGLLPHAPGGGATNPF